MFRLRGKQLLILVIALGSVFGFWLYRKYRVAPDIAVDQLPLKNLDGSAVEMNQFKGKTLFVNYWATWCGDCLGEMPSIQSARNLVDTNKVVFLMISDDSPDKIEAYLTKHNYHMKFVRIDLRLQEIGINTLPTTYIYDKDGSEILSKAGATDWSESAMIELIVRSYQ